MRIENEMKGIIMKSYVCTATLGLMLASISTLTIADEGVRTNTKVPSYTNNSDIKIGGAFDRGTSVTAQFNNQINLSIGSDGIASDYIFLTGKFSPQLPFTWYASVGGFYDWDETCHDDCGRYDSNGNRHHDSDHDYGIRAPFGLDWNFASRWDTYIQLAPAINIPDDFDLEFQGAIGIRYAL